MNPDLDLTLQRVIRAPRTTVERVDRRVALRKWWVTEDAPTGSDASGPVRSLLDEQMLDHFVARMRTDGARLTGSGGVLTEMLKAVLERGLHVGLRHQSVVATSLAGANEW